VDSSIVNKEIRRVVWPVLRNAGFTQFTARSAWRYVPSKIDVVNFQSFNSYLAHGVGCTTYSFALNLGCSFDTIPRLKTVEQKKGHLRPKEWECHFRFRLHKAIRQPELERTDTWYVDPAGQYLKAAIEDARKAILETGLGWFSRFNDSNEVLRTLLEDAKKMDGTHGLGNKPSPIRHLMTGYIASSLGKTELASDHLQAALLSGCFSDLDSNIRVLLEQMRQTP
jgi:hypothetical protein